ncbi:MAG: 50S ribosomal protein L6 [Candidatus Omnitrophota bacterium]|nr:MAG: 50S ribosomal protein L6 [Candidatus Omnitrophota bacterium]
MSRIGKQPIALPSGVKAQLQADTILIEGSKGKLTFKIPGAIKVEVVDNQVIVKRESEEKPVRSLHGTVRAIINNMVKGVSEGYKKELDIIGVGYKAQMKGKDLMLSMGFSHPVEIKVPQGLNVKVPKPTRIEIEGIDKQLLGEFVADIRALYPPEPYKGKGIRYVGEEVRKKLGKALAK